MNNHRPYRDVLTGEINKWDEEIGLRHAVTGAVVLLLLWSVLIALWIF